jgi:hypothetical protein
MAGRLSVGTVLEVGRYEADSESGDDIEWLELSAALPVGYEIVEKPRDRRQTDLFSLSLWAGPVVSALDGSYESGGIDMDFEDDRLLGFVGGVDIYLSRKVGGGAHISVFDRKVTVHASARYHF